MSKAAKNTGWVSPPWRDLQYELLELIELLADRGLASPVAPVTPHVERVYQPRRLVATS